MIKNLKLGQFHLDIISKLVNHSLHSHFLQRATSTTSTTSRALFPHGIICQHFPSYSCWNSGQRGGPHMGPIWVGDHSGKLPSTLPGMYLHKLKDVSCNLPSVWHLMSILSGKYFWGRSCMNHVSRITLFPHVEWRVRCMNATFQLQRQNYSHRSKCLHSIRPSFIFF